MSTRGTTRRRLLVGTGTVATTVIAGCSGGGGGSGDGDDATDRTPTTTETIGQDTPEQVEDVLSVVATTGKVTGDGSGIGELYLTVSPKPGAPEIDLSESTLEVVWSGGTARLTYGGDAPTFAVQSIQDDDGSVANSAVLNDPKDRGRIVVDTQQEGLSILGPGENLDVRIATQSGSNRIVTLSVPESLEAGSLVSL